MCGCMGICIYVYIYLYIHRPCFNFHKHSTAQIKSISPCNTRQTVFRLPGHWEARCLCNDDSGKQPVQLIVIPDDKSNAIVVNHLLNVVVICMLAKSWISGLRYCITES